MGRTSDAKEKLLGVAFELIWNSSYGSVSVDQICDRAKVNKGSFYHFYGSKADLAVAAYEEHWKSHQAEMDKLFAPEVAPLERLSRWCAYIQQGQAEKAKKYGRVCGCPYASIGMELATQEDQIRAKSEELISRSVKYIERALVDAKREGSVDVANPQTTAQQVYAYILGIGLQAKISNDLAVLNSLEPTVMAMIGAKASMTA